MTDQLENTYHAVRDIVDAHVSELASQLHRASHGCSLGVMSAVELWESPKLFGDMCEQWDGYFQHKTLEK